MNIVIVTNDTYKGRRLLRQMKSEKNHVRFLARHHHFEDILMGVEPEFLTDRGAHPKSIWELSAESVILAIRVSSLV